MFEYQTIKKNVEDILLKEKGSKFIGYAYPIDNEDNIKKHLEKIKELHPKATHHCYAFRLGMNGENYRANDDGEPSGSAGLPIYNQLLANHLTNVLLIVVRYFGGTKLGVGGLVKTYKESAKLTLDHVEIITKELESEISISFKYSQQNTIFSLINKFDGKILSFEANDICTIKASVKTSQKKSISDQLSEMLVSFNFN